MILGFSDHERQGRALASRLGRRFHLVKVHRFPDGESRITLPTPLPERIVICRSLDRPNERLVELLLATEAARSLGARHVTLVAPYLCYMRQDIAFNPGEAISQRIVGRFLADHFDAVVTVDPHLHRIHDINEAIPGIHAKAVSCASLLGDFLRTHVRQPLLVGPDAESEQWVCAVARRVGLDYVISHKERLGDRDVRIALPERDYRGSEVVLIDDMVSTGHTAAVVAGELRARGAGSVHCVVTHALHNEDATRLMHDAGVEHIWSSDSVTHSTNAIALTPVLAQAIAAID